MNHPNPHDQPEEPECDACAGTGFLTLKLDGAITLGVCVLCDGRGTLSQAAQRELGEGEADQRKIDERRGK